MGDGATGTDLFMSGLETAFPPEWGNVEEPADTVLDRQGRRLVATGSMGPIGELFELMGRLTHQTT